MSFDYKINPELTIPIYRQLADAISSAIRKGELSDKERLPTVQELSDKLGVARGTVKKVYDELEQTGFIEKVQGRGTFVNFRSSDSVSRKEQAMTSIDTMLDKLEELGFSTAEINIYLNLKLKERADRTDKVKIALFECNPEALSDITEQVRKIKSVEIFSYLLEDVKRNPYKVDENYDVVVTTRYHADEVADILPFKTRVVRAALRLTPECLSGIVMLRPGQKVGIACYSERFGTLILNTCKIYAEEVIVDKPFIFSAENDIVDYLDGMDAVLVPGNYEKYCDFRTSQALKAYKGQLICCTYEFDEGSILYLNEKTKRILESKQI